MPAFDLLGSSVDALGLGDQLQQQVVNETDEMRKKRMAELQQRQSLGTSGSAAVTSLFGMGGTPSAGI